MTTIDPMTLKSERSAKLRMNKLDKRYDAAIAARNAVTGKARESGWCDELFAETAKHEAEMRAIYEQMEGLYLASKVRGWWVTGQWYKYMTSTHAQLVAQNRD